MEQIIQNHLIFGNILDLLDLQSIKILITAYNLTPNQYIQRDIIDPKKRLFLHQWLIGFEDFQNLKIDQLTSLTELFLYNNQIHEIPAEEITQLISLTELGLCYNKINKIPKTIYSNWR